MSRDPESPPKETAAYLSLRSWVIASLCSIPVGGITIFWCLFHLGLGIPIKLLLEPFLVVSVLTLLIAPSLYWSRKQDAIRDGNHKRLYFVAANYTLLSTLIYIHFGAAAGVIPTHRVGFFDVLALICIPVFYFSGFYLRKILFPRTLPGRPSC
jgi:hypothetical protein